MSLAINEFDVYDIEAMYCHACDAPHEGSCVSKATARIASGTILTPTFWDRFVLGFCATLIVCGIGLWLVGLL